MTNKHYIWIIGGVLMLYILWDNGAFSASSSAGSTKTNQ